MTINVMPDGIFVNTNNNETSPIQLANVDVRALVKRVDELEKIVAEQTELINALWYHPGMPGHTESLTRLGCKAEKK
jgi:hypothetical protein